MNGYIDLKQAQVFIKDGYSNAGAVNNASGYAEAATTMVIDSLTGIIAVGTLFTLTGDDTQYEVTAHGETSGNTRTITFIPGLVVAATDNEVITFLPHQIEIRIGEGNLTYEEKKPREYKLNRGRLDVVRNGNETQMEVNFDFVWDHIVGSTGDPITVHEAIKGTGRASGWVSSATEGCEPYAVDLVVLYKPICEEEEWEQIIFPDFRYESLGGNLKEGTVACKGACNVTEAIVTRLAAA